MSAVDLAQLVRSDFHLCEQWDILKRHGEGFETSPAPNRNGSHEDRVMATKPLPSPEVLRQLLRYDHEAECLFWNHRSIELFPDLRSCNAWNARYAGKKVGIWIDPKGYARMRLFDRPYLAHRLIWAYFNGRWPELEIDHINGNPADNRPVNLREASRSQNNQNCANRNKGKRDWKGVSLTKSKKWEARIKSNGLGFHIGTFGCPTAAAIAYDAAAIKRHGEFAVTNFPARAILAKLAVQP